MFSSPGGIFIFPELLGGAEDGWRCAGSDFLGVGGLFTGVVAAMSWPSCGEGARAVGTGSGIVVECVAGTDGTGIWVVLGAVIIGACCCWAVGSGWPSVTGALPL